MTRRVRLALVAVVLTVVLSGAVALAAALALTTQKVTVFASCHLRTSSADQYVDQGSPTSNFGASSDLYVLSKSGSANRRTLVRIDLASCAIPSGAEITTAQLSLYMTGAPGSTRTYEVRRATSAWTEAAVTWNTQPTVSGAATSTVVTGTTADVRLVWNVAADVQAFVGGTTNNGWRIADTVEGSAASPEGKLASKEHGTTAWRPLLTITYYP